MVEKGEFLTSHIHNHGAAASTDRIQLFDLLQIKNMEEHLAQL